MIFWELLANVLIFAMLFTAGTGLIFGGIVSFMTRKDGNERAEKLEADNIKLARALDRANMKGHRYQAELAQTRNKLRAYEQKQFEKNAEQFFGIRED